MSSHRTHGSRQRRRSRAGVALVVSLAVLVAAHPAAASTGWSSADLTALTGAPPRLDPYALFCYNTDLVGQGPTVRLLYLSYGAHVQELSVTGGGSWQVTDLTAAAGAPPARYPATGHGIDFADEGPSQRVVYVTVDGDIEELRRTGTYGWQRTNLSALTGATPPISVPVVYTTNLDGQGPTERIVYIPDSTRHVEELSHSSGGFWQRRDLTALTGGPRALAVYQGYTTKLAGEGPAARLLYEAEDSNLQELSFTGAKGWRNTDLAALTAAPQPKFAAMGYQTNLTGQGPVARVVYWTAFNHVEELSLTGGGSWRASDLTAVSGSLATDSIPAGYTTSFTGQGQVARVVYFNSQGHVEELSTAGGGWSRADLGILAGAPHADMSSVGYRPYALTTTLAGQGQTARVFYWTTDRHIEEVSITP